MGLTSTASPTPKTFHIFYGWAEGKEIGLVLSGALQKAGYKEVPISEATILVAHSVGSYLSPKSHRNKVILLVGPPYWPNKSVVKRALQKIWLDIILSFKNNLIKYWLVKSARNIYYTLRKPGMNITMWHAVHKITPFVGIPVHTIIIRNQDDPFCTPKIADLLKYQVITLPGQHDDLWINTKPYIEIIEEAYAKLLA